MITAVNDFLDDLRGGKMTDAPIVRVAQGELQGKVVNTSSGKAFYSFQGIPYAKPPLGSLRFKAPEPPEPWEGVRDATAEAAIAPQKAYVKTSLPYAGDENCLYLNVYTPNLDGEFLPVMFYIHGGGFVHGSGGTNMHGPEFLVEKDVVLITFNYRLGALGFLSLNTPEVPGNAGLKDIALALKWVKENIHNFGGNSGNITVFGESAGGAAVCLLKASPTTKDLVNKAIVQSGTALNRWVWQRNPVETATKLAKSLGCESDDVDDVLEYLNSTPAKDIVEATDKMHSIRNFIENKAVFAPVVEKEFPGVEAFLTESFFDILTTGRLADVPTMIGSTTLEFAFDRTTDDLQIFVPEEFNLGVNTTESIAIAEKIKQLYFKDGNHTGVESLENYFELVSDKLINVDTHRYIQYIVQVSNKPVYQYKFDYVGELNICRQLLEYLNLKHAGHLDELGYLFNNDLHKNVEPTPQDLKVRERVVRLWTNFAKTGNPTPDENHYITVSWLPVTKDNLYYLKISDELSVDTSPNHEKMAFWDELYSKHFKIWEQEKVNTDVPPVRKTPDLVEDVVEPAVQPEVVDVVETIESVSELKVVEDVEPETGEPEPAPEVVQVNEDKPLIVEAEEKQNGNVTAAVAVTNGNGVAKLDEVDKADVKKTRPSNEIKMVHNPNGAPKDVIRANDPPEDDLPKNIGVNKFVNFFESLGGKK